MTKTALNWLALMCFLYVAIRAYTQSPASSDPASPSTTLPALIGMCEDSDGCSDWGFSGVQGMGLWSDGADATLTITHFDSKSISVHRVDTKGFGAGIVADYTGTITDNWIEGDATASWPGHQQGVTHTAWHGLIFPSQAAVRNTAKAYETALKQTSASWAICSDFGNKCSVPNPPIDTLLVTAGQSGAMHISADNSAQIFVYVDESPNGSISIRRFDKTGIFAGATIHYTGRRENGRIIGTFKSIWPGHGNMPASGKFVAISSPDHCTSTMSPDADMQTSQTANLLEDKVRSYNCVLLAANQHDDGAEAVLGLYYYTGWGTPVDYKKARAWLEKAGDQDEALAGLAAMYQKGQGGPVDLLKGHYLADHVELHKRYRKRFPNGEPPAFIKDTVNKFGDLFAWIYNLSDDNQIEPLEAKLDHEAIIVAYMDKGRSRVQSEEAFLADLEERHAQSRSTCTKSEVPDSPVYRQGHHGYLLRQHAQEELDGNYSTRVMINNLSESSFQEHMQDYLSCVQKTVDSNAIEDRCQFPTPRFGS